MSSCAEAPELINQDPYGARLDHAAASPRPRAPHPALLSARDYQALAADG